MSSIHFTKIYGILEHVHVESKQACKWKYFVRYPTILNPTVSVFCLHFSITAAVAIFAVANATSCYYCLYHTLLWELSLPTLLLLYSIITATVNTTLTSIIANVAIFFLLLYHFCCCHFLSSLSTFFHCPCCSHQHQ